MGGHLQHNKKEAACAGSLRAEHGGCGHSSESNNKIYIQTQKKINKEVENSFCKATELNASEFLINEE